MNVQTHLFGPINVLRIPCLAFLVSDSRANSKLLILWCSCDCHHKSPLFFVSTKRNSRTGLDVLTFVLLPLLVRRTCEFCSSLWIFGGRNCIPIVLWVNLRPLTLDSHRMSLVERVCIGRYFLRFRWSVVSTRAIDWEQTTDQERQSGEIG